MRAAVRRCRLFSKAGQAKVSNDAFGDRTPSSECDHAAQFDQLAFGRGIDDVAFTQCLPIQPVGFVQNDFVDFGFAGGSLRGAENDANAGFEPDPLLCA